MYASMAVSRASLSFATAWSAFASATAFSSTPVAAFSTFASSCLPHEASIAARRTAIATNAMFARITPTPLKSRTKIWIIEASKASGQLALAQSEGPPINLRAESAACSVGVELHGLIRERNLGRIDGLHEGFRLLPARFAPPQQGAAPGCSRVRTRERG